MNFNKLDFVVIGAQKCATSWMFYCLREHPELSLPIKKQELGYIGGEMFYAEGKEDWFFRRFVEKSSATLRGDVSVDYLYDKTACQVLKGYMNLDNAKFIVSLRNPVDRMISSYFWLLRRGRLKYLPMEEGIQSILQQPFGFPNTLPGALEEVVRRGCYHDQLKCYIDLFGKESICVVLYEDVLKDSLETIQSVYRFLEIEDSFVPPSLRVKPKKNSYNRLMIKFERWFNNKCGIKIANVINQALTSVKDSKLGLSEETRFKLQELYEPEVQATKKLIMSLPESQRPSCKTLDDFWGY